ncbi:hypothetical protein [Actinoplanes rectilineatus]|uniref:hypothetical protein n=1 Tax=Actinoplanes rectilineatus TaxID=113571 RepID=UPI0005F288F7|nr:hypothetical protein [Actinoplanes rectilineatus]
MTVRPRLRKLMLVAHVGASVGWLGAIAASLVLAVLALTVADPAVACAAYLVLEPLGWAALVPFSLASLVTGVIQSLISTWGLVRHYWVLIKLVMNVFATGVLLLYMQTLEVLAGLARRATEVGAAVSPTPSPVLHAGAAIVLLMLALVLSVFKPRGLTPWGYRERRASGRAATP